MFACYDVEIIEKRPDNKLYLCATKTFLSFKKALRFAIDAMDNIKYYPNNVIIYKTVLNGFRCKSIIRIQDDTDTIASFDGIDLYLN